MPQRLPVAKNMENDSKIQKMVEEAEKFKEEDEKNAARIQSKNQLENYCFSMKNSINDEKIKEKVEQEDKDTITKTLEDALKWLDDNQEADKEVFENKQKEVEEICKPIMMKLFTNYDRTRRFD